MSHGCRSGLAVDDKADTATGALVSVENYYFCFLPPTALPETRPWAARQPSWKPPWAAATDGRTLDCCEVLVPRVGHQGFTTIEW